MEREDNNQTCQQCGKGLGTKSVQGMCPACLLQAGWPTEEGLTDTAQGSASAFEPPSLDVLKDLFPQLEILELIGRGGMGAVYKARQPDLDRFVAIKILSKRFESDPGFAERFNREARALARLSHPHIVNVYDFGHKSDLSYFVMEFVDGPNLREIQQAGKLSPAEALAIVPQICEALQFAHDEGVVHRDIKPENILLDQKGRVKIADFGLAKIVGQGPRNLTLTQEGHVMGTPHYMAPEQIEHPKDVDHRADIYSLGVVFYEMLTGELPLGKFPPPSRMVQVDVRLDEIVLKTLEKKPEQRYQQVNDVRTEVETIVVNPAQPIPRNSKADESLSEESIAEVKRGLQIPGLGVFVAGIVNLAVIIVVIIAKVVNEDYSELIVGVAFLVVPVLILLGASYLRQLKYYRIAVVASVLALITPGAALSFPFAIWALVLLNQKKTRQAFEQSRCKAASRSASQLLLPKPDYGKAIRTTLMVLIIHAILFVGIGCLLLFAVPQFKAVLEEMVGGELNLLTRAVLQFSSYLSVFGLPILFAILVGDGIIVFLLSAYCRRMVVHLWSLLVLCGLLLFAGAFVVAFVLPLWQIQEALRG